MKDYNRITTLLYSCILTQISASAAPFFFNNEAANKSTTSELSLADSSRIFNLDEVVVVSQSKESLVLRKQPIASNIFTSAETTALGLRDISDLSSFVPSFQMPSYGSRLTSSMYIRGIGSRINNPAVGLYIDGMPILSKSAFNTHIYQIDRADVLRGPQGTLYGMNTEGGLVKVYSKNPFTHKGTEVKLGIGNGLYRNAEIATYQKLSESLAMSVAGFYNGQNGFFKNSTTGKRAGSSNEAGGKMRFVYLRSNRLTYDFTADYQYTDQRSFPYGTLDLSTNRVSSPTTNRDNTYRRNMFNSALNIKYVMQDMAFNSTTSYQFLNDDMNMDQDYTALDFMHLQQKQLQNGFTQEFVLKGTKKRWHHTTGLFLSRQWTKTDAPVSFDKDFTDNMGATIQSAMYNAMVSSMKDKFSKIPGMTEEAAEQKAKETISRAGGVSVNSLSMAVPGLFHTPQFNLGIFHESAFDLTDRLTMTIGLRYDYNHVKIDYTTSATMDVAVSVMGIDASSKLRSILCNSNKNDFNQVLPKLGFTLNISDNGSNIYALVNKGYRSGGYNIQMFSDILQSELRANSSTAMRADHDIPHTEEDYSKINSTISYKPEFCWNYEVGSHLNIFNNTVQADFSLFYMKIRNQQLSVMAGTYGFGRMMVNAGRSHSCGVEASLRGKAFDNNLSWSAAYSYTNSKFSKYTEEKNGNIIDYSGNYIPFIPQHTISAAADWIVPFKSNVIKSIVIGVNTKAQGKIFWDEANTFSQKLYATADAHIDANMKSLTVSIWSRNITNTRYNTFAFSSSATGRQTYLAQRGNPFQIGADATIRF